MSEVTFGVLGDESNTKRYRLIVHSEPELDELIVSVLTRRRWWQFWQKPKIEYHCWERPNA